MSTVRMPPTASVTEKVRNAKAIKTVTPESIRKMERIFCMCVDLSSERNVVLRSLLCKVSMAFCWLAT
jgi:hypothetical protein